MFERKSISTMPMPPSSNSAERVETGEKNPEKNVSRSERRQNEDELLEQDRESNRPQNYEITSKIFNFMTSISIRSARSLRGRKANGERIQV